MTNPVYTQGWTDERKLLLKMVEIYKTVQYIQKRGHNKFHNYKYATEADVNEKVREELSSRNIIMMPSIIHRELRTTTTKSGNTEYIYRVDMEFTFMDAETGESLIVPMSGEGQDVGDKAIFKAISGCQKYALMKAFMIPTGDDPEGDEGVDERNHREPHKTAQTPGTLKSSQGLVTTQEPSQPPTKTQAVKALLGGPMLTESQANYAAKLKKEKRVSDEDFRRMVAELAEGNTDLYQMSKKAAGELINLLQNIQMAGA